MRPCSRSIRHLATFCVVLTTLVVLSACENAVEEVGSGPWPGSNSLNPNPGVGGATFLGNNQGTALEVQIFGRGTCNAVKLVAGDGLTEFISGPVSFATSSTWLPLTYPISGWPGRKTLRVYGYSGCTGTASKEVFVMLPGKHASNVDALRVFVGMVPTSTTCAPVGNYPPLRPGTIVTSFAVDTQRINFGCAFNGCVHGIDGSPNSTAGNVFPFPGLREYSLVFRVGSQVAQGGAGATFTVTQRGPLEMCLNDNTLANNSGSWAFQLEVDERNAN